MITQGMMTSNSSEWETPQDFFDQYNRVFHFELDVCARPENAKCARYYTPEEDGLSQEWKGTCWMNPPYGREISKWVKKAYETALGGHCVVCLLPSRTDTAWFQDYCMKSKDIRFIRGAAEIRRSKKQRAFSQCRCSVFVGNNNRQERYKMIDNEKYKTVALLAAAMQIIAGIYLVIQSWRLNK